jgi:glycosyltransferase involved in cell wall biosynthesis
MSRDDQRNLLVLAYYFPPCGGAGVQRTLKYVKYLPQFGWQPQVVTAQPRAFAVSDSTLIQDLPTGLSVYTTPIRMLPKALPWRVRSWLARWVLVSDQQAGWAPFAQRQAEALIQRRQVQAIYTTSAPYTAHLVGLRLKQRFGLPWVADFRDPWVGNMTLNPPTAWHRMRIQRWERQVVAMADRVTVVSEPMAQAFRAAYPESNPQHFLTLPNGYDPEDFAQVEPLRRHPDRLGIVYTGSFYGDRQTPRYFLQGLRQACEAVPDLRQAIRVTLVGNVGQTTMPMVESLGLMDMVHATGYCSHRESIAYLLGADALLLIIGPGPGSEVVFTGKIFEYLAASKPILALVPAGAAADLVRSSRAGVVVDPADPAAIAQQLVAMFHQWQRGDLICTGDPAVIARFDRRRLTEALAQALDAMIPGLAEETGRA